MQCAAGTIWDGALPGCNHPWAVVKPAPLGCPDPEGMSANGVVGRKDPDSFEDETQDDEDLDKAFDDK